MTVDEAGERVFDEGLQRVPRFQTSGSNKHVLVIITI